MAEIDAENTLGFVDKRRGRGVNGAQVTSPANFSSVSDLRAALTAANGTYFTSARLNSMTKNDMVYALRLASESGGIN